MITTTQLSPGVVLTHCPDRRFKKCALSIQLLRPMCYEEAALNALLPSIPLRGTVKYPDMRAITWRLDELYGAGIHTLVRRVGDVQTVGFYLECLEDRFAMEPEGVLSGAVELLTQVLLEPLTADGAFDPEIVDSEKKNLIATIEAERDNKRAYAAEQMFRIMCQGDSFALPRLGRVEEVAAITPEGLYEHYRKILRESPAVICYVGAAEPDRVAALLAPLAARLGTDVRYTPVQTPFLPRTPGGAFTETLEINQGKLSMGFTTTVTNATAEHIPMRVFNSIFGGGMTNKLFNHLRETLGLCYYASSAYYGDKGILTVSSGIDAENYNRVRTEVLAMLSACVRGEITERELSDAKQSILSGLRSVPDSPGALESYVSLGGISGGHLPLEEYIARVEQVTLDDVIRCAGTVKLHTVYFLKGVEA